MTADTEVPVIIPKEERKKQPDQNEYEKKMRDFDAQAENLRNKIVSIHSSFNGYVENSCRQKERSA